MELKEQKTYFKCIHCHKDVIHLNTLDGLCAECVYMKCLGIHTISDYNNHLRNNLKE